MASIDKSFGGIAFYDGDQYFMFSPDVTEPYSVKGFRARGIAQQMTDGTFDFVPCAPKKNSRTELIGKLAHGRLGKMKDGAFRLTLIFYPSECVDIKSTLISEAWEAGSYLEKYLNTAKEQ